MTKRACLKIWGAVQGVSFRYFTQRKAREFGINGFVRNDPEGTVTLEAEGKEEALQKFIDACKIGPETARVEKIDISWQDEIAGYRDFSVRY